ncbi:MAG: HEAT repeat domain-containing protein, partial [Proteobacteria bacterium]|nr:HEAT repeat domain-containing protein [Pseudomonadota bacterium]
LMITDPDLRQSAALELRDLNLSDYAQIIRILITHLQGIDYDLQSRALEAAVRLGLSHDAHIIDTLISLLGKQEQNIVVNAIHLIRRFNLASNSKIMNRLCELLLHEDPKIGTETTDALVSLGRGNDRVLSILAEMLNQIHWQLQMSAIYGFGKLALIGDQDTIDLLIRKLSSNQSYEQIPRSEDKFIIEKTIVRALVELIQEKNEVFIEALIVLLEKGIHTEYLFYALIKFQVIGNPRVIRCLINFIGSGSDYKYGDEFMFSYQGYDYALYVQMLGLLVTQGDTEVVNLLIKVSGDSDDIVSSCVAEALSRIANPGDPKVIKALEQRFALSARDGSFNRTKVYASRIDALGKIGTTNVIDLVNFALFQSPPLLIHPDYALFIGAVNAFVNLNLIGDSRILEFLIEIFEDYEFDEWRSGYRREYRLGQGRCNDVAFNFRARIAEGLGKLSHLEDERVMSLLRNALNDNKEEVRKRSLDSLCALSKDPEALLESLLNYQEKTVALYAAHKLIQLKRRDNQIISALENIILQDNLKLQMHAIELSFEHNLINAAMIEQMFILLGTHYPVQKIRLCEILIFLGFGLDDRVIHSLIEVAKENTHQSKAEAFRLLGELDVATTFKFFFIQHLRASVPNENISEPNLSDRIPHDTNLRN